MTKDEDDGRGAKPTAATATRSARIVGSVEYREGDGPMLLIPSGPVTIETSAADATFSWSDGEAQFAAAMPRASFDAYVESGAIEVER